jgi:hypothetical protein
MPEMFHKCPGELKFLESGHLSGHSSPNHWMSKMNQSWIFLRPQFQITELLAYLCGHIFFIVRYMIKTFHYSCSILVLLTITAWSNVCHSINSSSGNLISRWSHSSWINLRIAAVSTSLSTARKIFFTSLLWQIYSPIYSVLRLLNLRCQTASPKVSEHWY